MLKKCMGDPSLIIPAKNIRIKYNLSCEEVPVLILDCHFHKLRNKDGALIKVLWRNQFVEECIWWVMKI